MNMRHFIVTICALCAIASASFGQNWWNQNTLLKPYRLPQPAIGAEVEKLDINGDGKQDAVKFIINGSSPLLWLDDDGNMKEGDLVGDCVNDCILVDRNNDGKYDFIVKHVDNDGDGKADLQFILDYTIGGGEPKMWNSPHYMIVLDEDNDGVFNYVDWNTVTLKCWEKNGLSDFYTDYSGNTSFIKVHRTTLDMVDLRYNWENPFIFYDYDKDGLTEIALRYCDDPIKDADATAKGFGRTQYLGNMGWFSVGIDMDNDNCPGNDFDFDMTLHYKAKSAFQYHNEVHPIKNMRGLPEADKFFPDPRIRLLEELIYPDRDRAYEMAFAGQWKSARFTWDEDDDCGRWERVELYEDKDAFKIGNRNGGVDNHTQSDVSGDRGEWDNDFSGNGDIYVGKFDGRIHLYGAERGVWRIDQNTNYYQGFDKGFQKTVPAKAACVEYLDTDNNGFFDTLNYDLDGDAKYETTVSLKELGLSDVCDVVDVSSLKYKGYTKLFKNVSANMWKNAQEAMKIADQYGVGTFWYGKMKNPLDLREHYHDGWWLQFYIYKDLEYKFLDDAKRAGTSPEENLKKLAQAYYSGNWKLLAK